MSYQSAKRQTLSDKQGVFSGGYVDNVGNVDLAPHFSPYLRNARIDGQSVIIRPGHQLHSTLTVGSYPKGIGSYLRSNPTNDSLIVRHNQSSTQKLVTINNGGAISPITTTGLISSDNKMTFLNIGDKVYCANGSDDYGVYDGTTYSHVSTGIVGFAPAFSVLFNGSIFASGRSTNSQIVYKSRGDLIEDFNGAGSDQFTFSEQVTGLSANNEALFYFTKNTVSVTGKNDITDTAGTISYTWRSLQVKDGAVNHHSIVEAGNNIYYLSSSNSINKVATGNNINGYEIQDLSTRKRKGISTIMSTLDDDQSQSFGYYMPKENTIKRFVKTKGASFNDLCIVYDTVQDTFLIDTQKYFYDGIYHKGINYTISMIESKVYIDEYSQDDEGSIIPFEYHTKEFYFGDPTMKKILRESRTLLDVNELAELNQYIYIDGQQSDSKTIIGSEIVSNESGMGTSEIATYAVGDDGGDSYIDYVETYILRTKGNLNKKGRKFQRRFTNNTLAGKVRLKNITAKVEFLPEIASTLY